MRVKVSLLGNRVVEGGVEDGDLRNVFAQQFLRCLDAFDVVGIVQRREVDALLDVLQDLVVDQRRLREQLSAMHHAMSNGVDIARSS